ADPLQEWTLDPAEANKDAKGKAVLFSRKGAQGKGSPAAVNHGNFPPQIDGSAGGVTISHGVQTTVLSLAALRRLRFATTIDGRSLAAGVERDAAELAARTALAALGLAAVVYGRESVFDLRSRSVLVPSASPSFEMLLRDGGDPRRFGLD